MRFAAGIGPATLRNPLCVCVCVIRPGRDPLHQCLERVLVVEVYWRVPLNVDALHHHAGMLLLSSAAMACSPFKYL